MIRKLNKIACFTISIFLIMLSPIGSYVQGENAKAYALENTIDDAIAKYALPVAAYMTWQYEQSMKGVTNAVGTITEFNNIITNFENNKAQLISTIPIVSKAIIADIWTNLTTEDINTALGTSYTDSELTNLSASLLQAKTDGLLGAEYSQIYNLGISHIFANSLKLYNNDGLDKTANLTASPFGNLYFKSVELSNGLDYSIKINSFDKEFWNLFNIPVYVSSQLGLYGNNCVSNTSVYQFGNIRLNTYGYSPTVYDESSSSYNLELYPSRSIISNFFNTTTYSTGTKNKIVMQYFYNDEWHTVKTYGDSGTLKLLTTTANIISDILTYTGQDYTSSKFYTTPLYMYDVMNLTYEGSIVLNTSGTRSEALSIPSIGSNFWDEPDTSISDAERLITAIGAGTNTYDLNIGTDAKVNDDPDTNTTTPVISDITVGDVAQSVPDVDTSNPGGEIGDPDDTSGILNWLKGFWDLLKSLWERLLAFLASIVALLSNLFNITKSSSEAAEGIDWGNFKGFFDIFYIFYYLIIIVILILLKFLVVVINLLSIPANTALFDSYPTMLAGLNYLKGLKVGGFSVTVQQLFEYMFTVFFFLFIVTVLQKLYHSFTGIERQQARYDRDIKFDNSNVSHRSSLTSDNDINKRYSEYKSFNQDIYDRENNPKNNDISDIPDYINYQDLR